MLTTLIVPALSEESPLQSELRDEDQRSSCCSTELLTSGRGQYMQISDVWLCISLFTLYSSIGTKRQKICQCFFFFEEE